jgi:hypothetical protein
MATAPRGVGKGAISFHSLSPIVSAQQALKGARFCSMNPPQA